MCSYNKWKTNPSSSNNNNNILGLQHILTLFYSVCQRYRLFIYLLLKKRKSYLWCILQKKVTLLNASLQKSTQSNQFTFYCTCKPSR